MNEKEIKIIEEKEYINEEGKLVKEKVVEVITKVVLKKVSVKSNKKEKSEMEDKERRHNYYLINKTELNEENRRRKAERYANDPEYREKVIERSKKYKLKKKMEKEMSENNE